MASAFLAGVSVVTRLPNLAQAEKQSRGNVMGQDGKGDEREAHTDVSWLCTATLSIGSVLQSLINRAERKH